MDKALLRFERDEGVAWVTLDNPASMNALSSTMLEQLSHVVEDIHGDTSIRCVVITGTGKAFCAGGDLLGFRAAVAEASPDALLDKLRYAQDVFDRIAALPMPVIGAVNGYAIAGGLELLLCCDMILAAESAKIGDGHARYGIIPGGGASARLPRKISANRANYLLLTGELLPARTMEDWGLVNRVVPDAELMETAGTLAQSICGHSSLGLRTIKDLLRDSMETNAAQATRAEIDAFADYAKSHDFAEGLAAFAEKREPKFTGR